MHKLLLLTILLTACASGPGTPEHARLLKPQTVGPQSSGPQSSGAGQPGVVARAGALRAWSLALRAWSLGTAGTAALAWDNAPYWNKLSLGVAQLQLAPRLGQGVTVAVIDTGLDLAHPAFTGRLAPPAAWLDLVDGDASPQEVPGDAYGHGTAVASIVLQVAPRATILPLRVLGGDGSGRDTDVAAAIDHAAALGARVIQLSLGTEEPSTAIAGAVERAAERGVYVVTSAGNSDSEPTYPARTATQPGRAGDHTVGVGSVDLQDAKSWFSNFVPEGSAAGDELELVSFGEDVHVALPGPARGTWDGTSMAAPMVAGALALAIAEGAEARHPGGLGLLVVDSSLEIDAEGSVGTGSYELEQRLEVARFLCAALGRTTAPCPPGDDDDDEGDGDD